MDPIVVIGGGGHAKVLVAVLRKLQRDIVGFTDPSATKVILGVARLGDDGILPSILHARGRCAAVVGVGKTDASALRMVLQESAEAVGYTFPVIVSPQALVNDEVELGRGTAVLDGAIVNSGTATGRACIVNTHSTLEHDCRLGDNVHVATGATVCGGVTIGRNCMIGAGATIVQGVDICADCVIGAGAVVTGNVERAGTYVGVPARSAR